MLAGKCLTCESIQQAAGLRLDNLREGYEQGQRDALALRDVAWAEGVAYGIQQAVQRVEALPWLGSGMQVNAFSTKAVVIAAIKGERA
jgi:hypothetical protein